MAIWRFYFKAFLCLSLMIWKSFVSLNLFFFFVGALLFFQKYFEISLFYRFKISMKCASVMSSLKYNKNCSNLMYPVWWSQTHTLISETTNTIKGINISITFKISCPFVCFFCVSVCLCEWIRQLDIHPPNTKCKCTVCITKYRHYMLQ